MIFIDYKHCTGCGACVQKCPRHCISWEKRDFGFRFPVIDERNCVNCGMCRAVCPIGKEIDKPQLQRVYAVVHKDKDILNKSTSGGMFTALAEYVLGRGGIVYGCSFEKDWIVKHIRIKNQNELSKLRGSKYVQSDIADTFNEAEKDLKAGTLVLYSGTPCQIVGLKHFLGREYDNLVTVDVVCHGIGAQSYFDKFMESLRERKGEIINLRFRAKDYVGWSYGGSIVSKDGSSSPFYDYNNYYYHYFLNGDIYRESCYSCLYASTKRQSDFTVGDFWGVESLGLSLDTYNGCSLVIVNSERSIQIFSDIDMIDKAEVRIESAVKHNAQLVHPVLYRESRKDRLQEYEIMTGAEIQKTYLKNNRKVLLRGWIKKMIPYSLKLKIRKGLF